MSFLKQFFWAFFFFALFEHIHDSTSGEKPMQKEVTTTAELKTKFITKWESGEQVLDLAVKSGTGESTISTILKNMEP